MTPLVLFLLVSFIEVEPIWRLEGETRFAPKPQEMQQNPRYPWEEEETTPFKRITKEHFRCKGNALNPPHIVEQNGEVVYHYDCGGVGKHSLPIRDGKEFIYPLLLDLLNHVQESFGKKVIITSGHRCLDHNTFVDASYRNHTSKHTIGAEAAFYVQGMEEEPLQVIQCLMEYFPKSPFQRYEKGDVDVSTLPWYNREIYIKLYKPHEGRNIDHRHPYPYISLQIRYDTHLNERVLFVWDQAVKGYHRY
ncbi:MAG: hypothetical protein KDK65_06940 [Chlamydiia bacterium]|nr:hypothetical protein [Chlamydiia bacterium]